MRLRNSHSSVENSSYELRRGMRNPPTLIDQMVPACRQRPPKVNDVNCEHYIVRFRPERSGVAMGKPLSKVHPSVGGVVHRDARADGDPGRPLG